MRVDSTANGDGDGDPPLSVGGPSVLTLAGLGHLLGRSLLGLQQLLDALGLTRHVALRYLREKKPSEGRRRTALLSAVDRRSADVRVTLRAAHVITRMSWGSAPPAASELESQIGFDR